MLSPKKMRASFVNLPEDICPPTPNRMLSPEKMRASFANGPEDICPDASSSSAKREQNVMSAEDIKQSKDRINSLRNFFPFYGHSQSNVKDLDDLSDCQDEPPLQQSLHRKHPDDDEEEKEICEGSDSEGLQDESLPSRNIVHSRVASYELPFKTLQLGTSSSIINSTNSISSSYLAINKGYQPTEVSNGKFLALKEKNKHQSVTNITYGELGFGLNDKPFIVDSQKFQDISVSTENEACRRPEGSVNLPSFRKTSAPGDSTQTDLVYKIKSEIKNIESRNKIERANVIVGNKDILKLLSNKHLANLNIRVERNPDFQKDRLTDNRWRENLGSFRASKTGIRSSFRSSKRKRKYKGRTNAPLHFEEKGASDSALKENDSGREETFIESRRPFASANNDGSLGSVGEYVKKKFPEYAKVNKKKSIGGSNTTDVPPRSLSTSPIERAPVVKKICSSGVRLKKDSELSIMANPVKKADSFRGSRVTRRNSFLYNSRGKSSKDGSDHESFVKTQAVRLRRKSSRNSMKSEYRVSVTIRPSTVANLANKFNTIILQNQIGSAGQDTDAPFGNISLQEPKVPKYYSSPRASFKRKYRHRAARAAKEAKGKDCPNLETEVRTETPPAIDNAIYFQENLPMRKSLNNSLSELNMKDLFEDCDYNKTDEEKVCEKLKTALSSGKFKGETDDSEDDLSTKPQQANEEQFSCTSSNSNVARTLQTKTEAPHEISEEGKNMTEDDTVPPANKYPSGDETETTKYPQKEGHLKNDSIDSGISADERKVNKKQSVSSFIGSKASEIDEFIDNCTKEQEQLSSTSEFKLELSEGELVKIENIVEAINTSLLVDNLIYAKADIVQSSGSDMKRQLSNTEFKEVHDSLQVDVLNIIVSEEAAQQNEHSEAKHQFERTYPVNKDEKCPESVEQKCLMSENENCPVKEEEKCLLSEKEKCLMSDVKQDSRCLVEDSNSEVSSICSDLKGKKSTKNEMRIYTSLKAVVKHTVKKTKEKDSERKSEGHQAPKRSPSRDRDKWYKRNKSKDRRIENLRGSKNERIEAGIMENPQELKPRTNCSNKEKKVKEGGRLYEKWTFRKQKDKHEEKNKEEDKSKENKPASENIVGEYNDYDNVSLISDTSKCQSLSSQTDDAKDELYGTVKFASRSRSREKRMAKNKKEPLKKVAEINEKMGIESFEGEIPSVGIKPKEENEEAIYSPASPVFPASLDASKDEAEKEEYSVYEPHSFKGIKVIPPPPKTPIPSPPKQFKKFLFKTKPKNSKRDLDRKHSPDSGEKNGEASENIYENIYSPDVETLKRNREKLEEEGIRPISSFLWSESAILSTKATLFKAKDPPEEPKRETIYGQFSKIKNGKLFKIQKDDQSLRCDKICSSSKASSDSSNSEGHNYIEIHNSSSGDSQTVAYDDIGAQSAVSYDEIAPPSCRYDDIRPPSSETYDPFKPASEGYDPVNPPKSDSSQYDDCDGGVVLAKLAVVREDQLDSFRYVYDDIATYNASQISHSYEPVCPPENTVQSIPQFPSKRIPETPHGEQKEEIVLEEEEKADEFVYDTDESGNGPHEVFSYKLTQIGAVVESNPPLKSSVTNAPPDCESKANKNIASDLRSKKHLTASSIKDESSKDVWVDVSDSEEDAEPVTLTTKIPFVGRERRPKRVPRYRAVKKSWTQGVRDVAASHNQKIQAHAHSLTSSLARVKPHAHGRAQITPTRAAKQNSSQGRSNSEQVETYSWRQIRTDSENDAESSGHYEAIYEVISPAEDESSSIQPVPPEEAQETQEKTEETVKDDLKEEYFQCPEDVDLDDSFDSDDSDEAYSRLRPQHPPHTLKTLSLTREAMLSSLSPESTLEQKFVRRKYNRSHSHQPHSINRIAEAANLGMKRLRRNWSLTKNEVRTGLSRIKKKSTFSMSDIKSTEDILNEVNYSSGDKGKWSFKSHFKRKSSTSAMMSPSGGASEEQKNNATFYLTLTIASDRHDASDEGTEGGQASLQERRKSISPSVSSVATTTSCETTTSAKASVRPLSTPAGTSLYRNSSSGSNSGTLFRPTNPPPAPPLASVSVGSLRNYVDEDLSSDMSKDTLALRLNQILSAGPVAPPGRRILRTSESCSSFDASPIPLLSPTEERITPCKYPLPPLNAASSLRQLFPDGGSLNSPQTRTSVASSSSHGSSEVYIRPSDIASSPPPLPARPSSASYPSLRRVSTGSTGPSLYPLLPIRNSDGDSRSYLELTCDSNQQEEEEPPYVSSHFADEPLYQFYTAKVERAALYQGESSEDDYEVINDGGLNASTLSKGPRPTAMELVTPTDGRRTLWCELPEVVNSGILGKITGQERKLQEAMFEVVTSEASYLKSLDVLVSHFMNCPEFSSDEDPIITRRDRNVLFSDILPVKKCSELFLGDLEKRWQESFYISSITDIILNHATSSFNVYVKYCSNQIYQDRKLRDLKENSPRFVEVLSRLETSPVCQSLAMQSFLMLPMQRVTRLPLLIDAIFNRLEYGSPQWQECKRALASLQKIVAECNEAARKMERMEEMLLVSHQLDFREVKAIPLISASRWLVKKGELTRLTWREGDAKLTFGRKISKHSLYFFLFTDLLVVTKKKSDDQHMVLDYCPRNMVQVLELESADKFPGRILDGHKNLLIMTMLQNHENKTVEVVLSCPLESDRSRWMEAVTPRTSDNPDERIYEEWDCPQVQAIHAYLAKQQDELGMDVSDVFNVLKKTPDGWYQGERLRDGARGWFPGNHTAEIASAHVRARNLRQRYRLLAISGSIVDELKKEKERFDKEAKKKERRRTITIKEVL